MAREADEERKGWENLIIMLKSKAVVGIGSLGIPSFVFKSKRGNRFIQFANNIHDPVT